MFSTVLLAVDPNHEESWAAALPKAAELARQSKGALHLAAVAPDLGTTIVAAAFPADFEAIALERAKADLAAFAAAHAPADVPTQTHVGHGHVAQEIARIAEEIGADLIVLGAQRHDAIRNLLIGSNADRIVNASPVSVLVVRG